MTVNSTLNDKELDKILSRLVSSVVGLKLANAKDYKEFVPTAKSALQSLLKQAELRGRIEGNNNAINTGLEILDEIDKILDTDNFQVPAMRKLSMIDIRMIRYRDNLNKAKLAELEAEVGEEG